MTKPTSKRRTRSDKFPLTLHKTGQFCKKIKGKIYYFGTDRRKAMERYLEQAACLHAGRPVSPEATAERLSIKTMCNLYLDHQESRVAIGEVKPRHLSDQVSLLKAFVRFVGPHRLVSDVATLDLQNYRTRLIGAKNLPNTINNRMAAVKAMYNWALDNEIIDHSPRLKALKKVTPQKTEKPTFTSSQVRALLQNAGVQMNAMIWLGLNCGFGCTDCAELKWKNVDLDQGRVTYPRGKTGIGRNLPLWPETVQALLAVPRQGELVFYTRSGNPWVRTMSNKQEDGTIKYTKDDAVTKEFSKLMKKAGIEVAKGVGFYTLRRTAATVAASSGDPFAVQKLLGHADVKMASTYVQNISEQTDRVINSSRKFIVDGGA
ncbi:MAG TPA: tyrosine-type recombinase/integrase [Sedimentisphaerales bacterium]|jgi:integrase|nr:tyrosine-type recombinase/integrase [Sedimentisphaerales bacterium]HNU28811.1 tyrosine-type recombinase/integrase [Sedimentisphaerales bacterium]